ncbi:hypothetical protein GJ496_011143, partial [Pomphorhynchus laevis]
MVVATKSTKSSKSKSLSAKKKKVQVHYTVDCTQPVEDGIMDTDSFKKFLTEKMKINGKTHNLKDQVVVKESGQKLEVNSSIPLSK